MSWNLSARMIECCNCNVLCPCWYGVEDLMVFDQDTCDGLMLYNIEEGNSEGTDLSGCIVGVSVSFPGPTLFSGNGTARLYIDEKATNDQRRELEKIFKGKVGGPMEIVGGLISDWLPTKSTSIDVQENGDTITATIGNFGTVKSQLLKNEQGQQMSFKNTGFADIFGFRDRVAHLAPSGSKWSDPDFPHRFETKSGAQGFAQWAGG